MKHILFIISFFALFQIGTAQEVWNACNSTVTVIPTPSYDSTFVLSAPSRAALAKGMASWTPSSSGGGSASYLVYTALLTQSGTDAPVATVLENTLGGTVVWTYDAPGRYIGTLSGAFSTSDKFWTNQPFTDYTPLGIYRNSANDVYVNTYNGIPFSADPTDGILSNTSIEIRVYP